MDRVSVAETVNSDSNPGRVKPKTIKIGIHSFPGLRSAIKRDSMKLHHAVRLTGGHWACDSLTRKPKDPFAVF